MCFFCLFVWFLFFGWNGACFLTGFLGCSRLCFYFFPLNPRGWHSALLLCITFCSDGHLLACCHLLSSLLSLLPDLSVFISLFFFGCCFSSLLNIPFATYFFPLSSHVLWDAPGHFLIDRGILHWLKMARFLEFHFAQALDVSRTGKSVILDVFAAKTDPEETNG